MADELILSYVPDPEQRRTPARTKARWARAKTRLQNPVKALVEEMRIQRSSLVSDLLGVSASRILHAIAEGEQNAKRLAEMADRALRARRKGAMRCRP